MLLERNPKPFRQDRGIFDSRHDGETLPGIDVLDQHGRMDGVHAESLVAAHMQTVTTRMCSHEFSDARWMNSPRKGTRPAMTGERIANIHPQHGQCQNQRDTEADHASPGSTRPQERGGKRGQCGQWQPVLDTE